MANFLEQQTILGVSRDDRWAVLSTLEQARSGDHVEARLHGFAAMALQAILAQDCVRLVSGTCERKKDADKLPEFSEGITHEKYSTAG
jgi:hypothetical protein